jgi:D-amino peptidase
MKIYVMTDIEAVAGVVSFSHHADASGRYYDNAKKLLTAEVNAAVEGVLEAGATDVLVADGHGYGGIWFEDLHPAVRLVHGGLPSGKMWGEVGRGYDACMMIGQHAMAGVASGNLNHTGDSATVDYVKINDRVIGEIGEFALLMGTYDVPMIFLSGDEEACAETRALLGSITTVAVKQGLGRHAAISLSAVEARRRIREGASQAVRQHQKMPLKPLKWPGPFVREVRYFHTDTADSACTRGAERVDSQTVRWRSNEIRDLIYR